MSLDPFVLKELGISIVIYLITHLSLRFFFQNLIQKPRNRKLPPGPKGWPIVGALPLLGNMPHVALAKLATQKYGPVMYLKMGTCDTVVASTPKAAKAFLKTLDLNFANRPPIAGSTHLGYNSQDMVFSDYGPKWKLLRRLTNHHMLGSKALEEWAHVREFEVKYMVKEIYNRSKDEKNVQVTIVDLLSCAITNMVSQVVLSRRIFEKEGSGSKEWKDMVVEFMVISGVNIGDFIPSVNWIDLQGLVGRMKKLHKRFDVVLENMVKEHVTSARDRKKPDLLDVLMDNASEEDPSGEKINFTSIKALLLNLFTAGTDTSGSIIEWALTEMLRNPSILQKAQQEIDQVVGKDRLLLESDIPKLSYLQAIVKETYRLHPSTPLGVPRVASQACEVDGYYIPKNTRLNVNIWAIGRDPNVWDNPLDFNPERFLSGKGAKISPNGIEFELIPFGGGRRVCVGYRMAMMVIEHVLGTLVHSFDWKLPFPVEELNMDEQFGITLQKNVPLAAFVSPRLLPHAYA